MEYGIKMYKDNRYKPSWLPQLSAPFSIIIKELTDNGFSWKELNKPASTLKPLQGTVDSDAVSSIIKDLNNGIKMNPIFISGDDEVLDGHHRLAAYISHPSYTDKEIACIKIMSDYKDAARILNKIQDLYDYQNKPTKKSFKEINQIQDGPKEFIAYRSEPIKEKSKSGNFFYLQKTKDMRFKFKIEFDNCLCLSEPDIVDSRTPIETLLIRLYQNADLVAKSKEYNLPYHIFLTRLLAKTIKRDGYDGICFGNKFIQGI